AVFTRNGHDWSAKLKSLCAALADMALPDGWYDGEIVVHDDHGIPDFQALQNAFEGRRPVDVVYYLFDLPFSEGQDLRNTPLMDRRNRLEALLDGKQTETIRFSSAFTVSGRDIVDSACKLGLEGV